MSKTFTEIQEYIKKKEAVRSRIATEIKTKEEEFKKSIAHKKFALFGYNKMIREANNETIAVNLGQLTEQLRIVYNCPKLSARAVTTEQQKGIFDLQTMKELTKELSATVDFSGYTKESIFNSDKSMIKPFTVKLGNFSTIQADGKTLEEHCLVKHFGFLPDFNDHTTIALSDLDNLIINIPYSQIKDNGSLSEAIILCEENQNTMENE